MKWLMLALAFFAAALLQADPSDAQTRRARLERQCNQDFVTWLIWPRCSERPRGTRASPHVYSGGTYAGQDPDPRIRAQLRRQFDTNGDGLP